MDNPEKLARLGTQDTRHRTKTNKTKTQHRKLKTRATWTTTKKPGVNPGAHRGQAVPASCKTPAMLLI